MTAARYRAACAALGLPVWRPGMLGLRDAPGYRDDRRPAIRVRFAGDSDAAEDMACVPDFTDPATVGVLLAAVREAWRDPVLTVRWSGNWPAWGEALSPTPWDWMAWHRSNIVGKGPTEADALIAALEAAAARRGGQP
jgi:hypothetical protein